MVWRITHQFLGWFPPSAGAAYLAVLGVAASAAPENPDAGAFLDGQIAMLRALVTAPYFPLSLALVVALWLAAFLWSGQKADATAQAGVSEAARPSLSEERTAKFNEAVLALRHIVNARELWFREVHRREGPSSLQNRPLEIISDIRSCFPPDAPGDFKEDPINRLWNAAMSYGRQLGYEHGETPRLAACREKFEQELQGVINRFEYLKRTGTTNPAEDLAHRRRDMIADARRIVVAYEPSGEDDRLYLERQPAYLQIRKYLSEAFHKQFSSDAIHAEISGGQVHVGLFRAFSRELDRLETEWGLDLLAPSAPAAPPSRSDGDALEMPFHEVLRHVAYDSAWAVSNDRLAGCGPNSVKDAEDALAKEVRHPLARGQIQAWGRHYIPGTNYEYEPGPSPIPAEFWRNSYFQPFGEILLAQDSRCIAALCRRNEQDPRDSYCEITIASGDVFSRWPARADPPPQMPTRLALEIEAYKRSFQDRPKMIFDLTFDMEENQ